MKKIKEYKGIIIIVLVLILGAFYWFELRPIQIKKHCYYISAELKEGLLHSVDFNSPDSYSLSSKTAKDNYDSCLEASGL